MMMYGPFFLGGVPLLLLKKKGWVDRRFDVMESMVLKVSMCSIREVRVRCTSEGYGNKVFAHRFMKPGSVLTVRIRPRMRTVFSPGRGGLSGVVDFSWGGEGGGEKWREKKNKDIPDRYSLFRGILISRSPIPFISRTRHRLSRASLLLHFRIHLLHQFRIYSRTHFRIQF